MKPSEQELWNVYRNGDDGAGRRLAKLHLPLAYKVARKMSISTGGRVEYEDLVGAAVEGLIRAVERFDPTEGNRFSTYSVPRIRGSVLDFLRSRDPASRSLRKRAREIQDVTDTLTQKLQRRPRDTEVARALDVEVEALWRWQNALETLDDVSLDTSAATESEDEESSRGDILADQGATDPLEDAIAQDQRRALHQALDELPDRDRQILALYYFEELTQADIGKVIGCSEARVSQLRSGAIKRLKERLRAYRN